MSRKKTFPLPKPNQILHTRFFRKVVENGILSGYEILWVGTPLTCRFKSATLKNVVGSQHVFILQKGEDFEYAVVDINNAFYKLPKKFFTSCFTNVTLANVPRHNRMNVKLTKHETVSLPYIPDSFYQSKLQKTTRKKRKIPQSDEKTVENIDYGKTFPSWTLLESPVIKHDTMKKSVMILIRSIIKEADRGSEYFLPTPFDATSLNELQSNPTEVAKLKLIVCFIYHYCRAELGCFVDEEFSSVREWIESMKTVSST